MGTHRKTGYPKVLFMNFSTEIKAKLYGESFKNASDQEIIEEVQNWKGLQITVFWENLRELKREFIEKEKIINFNYFIFPNFETIPKVSNTPFNFWESNELISFSYELLFYKAKFTGNTNFSKIAFNEKTDFSNVTFYQEANFKKSHFRKEIDFKKVEFKEDALFYETLFEKQVFFDESVFYARTVFHKSNFQEEASFSLVSSKYRITFFSCHAKKISFKYSRLDHAYFVKNRFKYLNLHGIAIQNPFFSDNKIKEAERETFAYIKHFFDNGNDYISANYYYAREMQSYQKELFPKTNAKFFKKVFHWFNKPNLGDKLVFGFSKIASNFGQNIFLPLYWIFFAGSLFVGLKGDHPILFLTLSLVLLSTLIMGILILRELTKQGRREDLVWLLGQVTLSFIVVGIVIYGGQFIGDFAKVINPIQIIRGTNTYCQGIELSCLLLRVFIATMVYHFVIASKRGVKR
jgi:uncharacterized protein YjbI with pentapeptide repeats